MIAIRNARIFDGKMLHQESMDILIREGRIDKIGRNLNIPAEASIIDAEGKLITPGFIDLHAHFREPGQEWREDIGTGARAAASGGFTTVVAMPNTDPPIDNPALVRFVLERGREEPGARILPAGCVSKERKGVEMAEMAKMIEAGAVLFTDDGSPIHNAKLLRLALLYSRTLGVRIMEHPEDPSLTGKAQVNEGLCSTLSGLKGWPACAEEIDVARGIALARDTQTSIHFTHVSTALALKQIRQAKHEGIPVTCDVTFHHLFFSEEAVMESEYDSAFKVNPPLRSLADRDALWDALADGTVDAIVTDHAPYHEDEKDVPFPEAPFGIASLECAVASLLTAWEQRGRKLPLERLLALLTSGPASLLPNTWSGLGRIEEGALADLTVLDLEESRIVDTAKWQSKAFNCPWEGKTLKGWPVATLIEGIPFITGGEALL